MTTTIHATDTTSYRRLDAETTVTDLLGDDGVAIPAIRVDVDQGRHLEASLRTTGRARVEIEAGEGTPRAIVLPGEGEGADVHVVAAMRDVMRAADRPGADAERRALLAIARQIREEARDPVYAKAYREMAIVARLPGYAPPPADGGRAYADAIDEYVRRAQTIADRRKAESGAIVSRMTSGCRALLPADVAWGAEIVRAAVADMADLQGDEWLEAARAVVLSVWDASDKCGNGYGEILAGVSADLLAVGCKEHGPEAGRSIVTPEISAAIMQRLFGR